MMVQNAPIMGRNILQCKIFSVLLYPPTAIRRPRGKAGQSAHPTCPAPPIGSVGQDDARTSRKANRSGNGMIGAPKILTPSIGGIRLIAPELRNVEILWNTRRHESLAEASYLDFGVLTFNDVLGSCSYSLATKRSPIVLHFHSSTPAASID